MWWHNPQTTKEPNAKNAHFEKGGAFFGPVEKGAKAGRARLFSGPGGTPPHTRGAVPFRQTPKSNNTLFNHKRHRFDDRPCDAPECGQAGRCQRRIGAQGCRRRGGFAVSIRRGGAGAWRRGTLQRAAFLAASRSGLPQRRKHKRYAGVRWGGRAGVLGNGSSSLGREKKHPPWGSNPRPHG